MVSQVIGLSLLTPNVSQFRSVLDAVASAVSKFPVFDVAVAVKGG